MRPHSSLLPILILALAALSIVTLRSIDPQYGTNQLLFFLTGLITYVAVSSVPYRWLRQGRWAAYIVIFALLVLTFIIGTTTNGSLSWIRIGNYRLQPSELLKPVLLFVLGIEASRRPLQSWRRVLRYGMLTFIPLSLVLLQPDLGTSIVILAGAGAIFLISQPKRSVVLTLFGLAIMGSALAWNLVLEPYQKDRLLTFVSPQHDPQGSGYNAQQAIIAVGSGQVWGKGWGNGLQSTLRFLPERQTDFLFSSYAEVTGLVGCLLVLGLYTGLFGWMEYTALHLELPEQQRVAIGLITSLFIQTFIHIGMNIGIAPVTGVTLPLFSLGGSSILATCLSLGLLEAMRRSSGSRQERVA